MAEVFRHWQGKGEIFVLMKMGQGPEQKRERYSYEMIRQSSKESVWMELIEWATGAGHERDSGREMGVARGRERRS